MGRPGPKIVGWGLLVAALALLVTSTASATSAPTPGIVIRSLYVGIDHYLHSHDHDPSADDTFHDLQGAVNDAHLMQVTLKSRYGVPFGPDCGPVSDTAITLIDRCARRADIIGALEHLISVSRPGDLIVFYYAGHGSQHIGDDGSGDGKVSGINSTVVPADAWRPPADGGSNDILDIDFRRLIDQANLVGVNVVTIFDSCHSGTATRGLDDMGGMTRAAPPDKYKAKPALTWNAPQSPAAISGYSVHMAGAGDNEVSFEWPVQVGVDSKGKPILEPHGAFTWALAGTLNALKGATYLDIAEQTRWAMAQAGRPQAVGVLMGGFCGAGEQCDNIGAAQQHSQEEGELSAPFLGAAPSPTRGYEAIATSDPVTVQINDGSVAGVTMGSTFRVYPSEGMAETSGNAFIGTGVVTAETYNTATLRLDAPLKLPSGPPQEQPRDPATGALLYWVQEQSHAYGPNRLPVLVSGDNSADTGVLNGVVDGLTDVFQSVGVASADYLLTVRCGQVAFQTRAQAASHPLAACAAGVAAASSQTQPQDDPYNPAAIWRGALGDAHLGDDLAANARIVANFNAILALRTGHSRGWGCVDIVPAGSTTIPCQNSPPARTANFRVQTGGADFWVTNTTSGQLYRYALFLDADTYAVQVIDPPPNASDPPLSPGQSLNFFSGDYRRKGRGTVLVLLTQDPIDVAALRQAGLPGTRGSSSPAILPGDYDVVSADVTAVASGSEQADVTKVGADKQ